MRRIVACAFGILAGGTALAQSSPSSDPTAADVPKIQAAPWTRLPTAEDLASVRRHGDPGLAKIVCTVQEQGTIGDCVVVEEDPPGHGLGEAALKLAPRFRMLKKLPDGKPTAGVKVIIPIRFP